MADNVQLNAMSGGDAVAAENLASVFYQRIKIVDATPGSSNALVVDSSGRLTANLAAGSSLTLAGGTLGLLAAGTVTTVGTIALLTAGTITSVGNIAGGSVTLTGAPAVTHAIDPSAGTVGLTTLFAPISLSSSGDATIVANASGKKTRVMSLMLVAAGSVTLTWKSGTVSLSGGMPMIANTGYAMGSNFGILEAASSADLILNLSASVGVTGHISYVQH